MASLGLHKTVSELRSITSSGKPAKPTTDIRKYCKKDYTIMPLRRSGRLKQTTSTPHVRVRPNCISLRRSDRLRGKEGKVGGVSEESDEESEESSPHRPANKPLVKVGGLELQLSPEYSARRCDSKGRGSVYDPVFGICCHFCRFLFMPFHYHEMTILLLLSLSNLFCYLNCLLRYFIGSWLVLLFIVVDYFIFLRFKLIYWFIHSFPGAIIMCFVLYSFTRIIMELCYMWLTLLRIHIGPQKNWD